ncbi:MAG: hypothetical protein CL790_06770 [Chloroflexi bacterium]|nr:hypothetical protein [Chloroflexota bacterium]
MKRLIFPLLIVLLLIGGCSNDSDVKEQLADFETENATPKSVAQTSTPTPTSTAISRTQPTSTATPSIQPTSTVVPSTTNQPVTSPDKEIALEYFESNELELGIEHIDRHIKLYPRDTSAYVFRGLAHLRLEKFQAALDDFNIVLTLPAVSTDPVELHDEKRSVYLTIADLSWELGLLQDSFNNLGNYLQVNDGFKTLPASDYARISETQNTIGWLIDGINYLDAEMYGKAIERFTEFIDCTWSGKPPTEGSMPEGCTEHNHNMFITWQGENEHPIGYFYRGLAYKELGDLQKATSDFTKVRELDSDNSRGFLRKATDAGF